MGIWQGGIGDAGAALPGAGSNDVLTIATHGLAPISGAPATVNATGRDVLLVDREALVNGDYSRSGNDLAITAPDGSVTVFSGYFSNPALPTLESADGAMLSGHTVSLLAGPASPGQYAQAGATPQNPIGEVASLAGSGTVQRADGTSEPLVQGLAVFEDDVVSTGDGSKLSLKFVDGTALSMSANARMVMDELIYDAGRTDNSMVVNLVQGSFVFVTGLVAKTGTVRADTPVATMGIRGTTPTVTVDSVTKTTTFGIAPDPDGTVGSYQIINLQTGQVLGTVSSVSFLYRLASINGSLQELPNDQTLNELELLLQDAYDAFRAGGTDGQNPDQEQQDPDRRGENSADPTKFAELINDLLTGSTSIEQLIAELTPTSEDVQTAFEELFTDPETGFLPTQETFIPGPADPEFAFNFSGSLSTSEDDATTINGFSITFAGTLAVTISVGSTITLASTEGLTVTGNGTSLVTLSGTPAAIMAALNGAQYNPSPDDEEGFLVFEFRDGATGELIGTSFLPVTVAPVPDAPVARADFFFDIPEDAGRDGNPAFTANLFDNNGNGSDFDPDEGGQQAFSVTRIRIDDADDGFSNDDWVVVDSVNGAIIYEEPGNPDAGYLQVFADGTITIVPGTDWDGTPAGSSQLIGSMQYEITSAADGLSSIGMATGFVTGENDAPVLAAALADQEFSEDGAISFSLPDNAFTDVDGDDLTISARLANGEDLPEWLSFDEVTFSGTPPEGFTGSLEIEVTASDGDLSTSDVFVLAVTEVNNAPVLEVPMPDQAFGLNEEINFSLPFLPFSDPDGDSLTISATLSNGDPLPQWLDFDGVTFSGTPPEGFHGVFEIEVTASDGDLSASDVFVVTIGNDGFEAGTFSNWSILAAAANDAVVVETLASGGGGSPQNVPPADGNYFAVLGSGSTSNIGSLETFLGLETGTIQAAADAGTVTGGTAITLSQSFSIGDVVYFDWYFDSGDYNPFRDTAFFVMPDGTVRILDQIDTTTQSGDVNASDSGDWQTMSFVITGEVSGSFSVGIVNIADTALESFVYLDNLRVLRAQGEIENANGDMVPRYLVTATGFGEQFAVYPDAVTVIDGFDPSGDTLDLTAFGSFGEGPPFVEIDWQLDDGGDVTGALVFIQTDGNAEAPLQHVATLEFNEAGQSPVLVTIPQGDFTLESEVFSFFLGNNDNVPVGSNGETYILEDGVFAEFEGVDPANDVFDISALFDIPFDGAAVGDLSYVSPNWIDETTADGASIFVDADGAGTASTFEEVGSLLFDQPVSAVVINLVFEQGGEAIQVAAA